MNVIIGDPDNHKIYGWITKEYFFAGLQRAKKEKICTNDEEFVDINKLLQLLWETFSDGSYLILSDKEMKNKFIKFIKEETKEKEKIKEIKKTTRKKKIKKEEQNIEKINEDNP
ncbi:MAG: hypothetical protein PHF86_14420 [Candidatus Nanoarchaeia archaeon]|jgi:hypothetical protein|nr:hypothetical protein [Candidatus Nanoarchaeia archaeon]